MTINAHALSAGATLDVLHHGWQAQSAGGLTASWMLHGRPGVGKTQIVRQLADRIGARLFDLRLTTIEPQDLRGLPYYDHDAKRTVWYRPEDLPDDPKTPQILFLDELTAAQPTLQPTVYGLLQERRVGRHLLPASVLIVAAGNTVEDGAIAYDMGTALSDRLIHVEVRADAAQWLEHYAPANAIHPAVTAFLRGRPDLFETTEQAIRQGLMVACTPRAWERVSDILKSVPDRAARNAMVAGTVGAAPAAEFAVIADDIAAATSIEDLLAASHRDRRAMYPATMHGLTAVIYGIVAVVDRKNAPQAIETMAEIRTLAEYRDEPAFAAMPLGELTAFGFEMLIRKALADGWHTAFGTSPAYRVYSAQRGG